MYVCVYTSPLLSSLQAFAKKHGLEGAAIRVLEEFIDRTIQEHVATPPVKATSSSSSSAGPGLSASSPWGEIEQQPLSTQSPGGK